MQLIKDVYKNEYAKATRASDKAALAAKLYTLAIATTDDSIARFVLFREARDLAAEAGAIQASFKAVEAISKEYDIDIVSMKTDSLILATKFAPVPSQKALAELALELAEEAIACDNYASATRLVEEAIVIAQTTKSGPLTQLAALRQKQVEEVKTAFKNVVGALALLKEQPDNAEANADVGKFFCFMKGDWDKGLPLLAAGKDPQLKKLAEAEAGLPTDAKERVVLGDGWWDLGEKATGVRVKANIQRRAGYWYRKAVSELTGLSQARVAQRIKELDKLGLIAVPDKKDPDKKVGLDDVQPDKPVALEGGFAGRRGDSKKRLLKGGGANEESELAVANGLAWLARQQMQDGGWQYEIGSKEERVAATGMVLLAFLGAGETHQKGEKYSKTVANGLQFLLRNCPLNGATAGRMSGNMYAHAIGTIALCEAYGMTKDKNLLGGAQAAISYIVKAQAANGSWGYSSGAPGDTSIVGWQVQALKAAKMGKDIVVPAATMKKAVDFLNLAGAGSRKAMYGYSDNTGAAPGTSLTSIGLLCRYNIDGWGPDNAGMAEGITGLMKRAPVKSAASPDIYFYYYATQVVHFFAGDEWKTWNEGPKGPDGNRKGGMRDWLVGLQITDNGEKQGSWDPDPGWIGRSCGRLGTTAMCILTLEVYYRYLPLH